MTTIEEKDLMFIVADPQVFKDYQIPIEEYTTLESGKIMMHASRCGLNVFQIGCAPEVAKLSQEAAIAYVEFVDGYADKQWVDTGEVIIKEEIPVIKG